MFSQYEHLVNIFIRPYRTQYNKHDLSQKNCLAYKRQDLEVKNNRGQVIQISWFKAWAKENQNLVIYCHCNSGSRLEGLSLLSQLLQNQTDLVCFDFTGCGLSDGEYITLGYNEQSDLECVVDYFYNLQAYNNIFLWGRSMGAVTNILYASKNENYTKIQAMVCDSPFINLYRLAREISNKKISGIPNFIINFGLNIIGNSIMEKTGLDINKLDLTNCINKIKLPIMFITSKEDTFVDNTHVEDLFQVYMFHLKEIQFVQGDHNNERSKKSMQETINFLKTYMKQNEFVGKNILVKNFSNQNLEQSQYKNYRKQKSMANLGNTFNNQSGVNKNISIFKTSNKTNNDLREKQPSQEYYQTFTLQQKINQSNQRNLDQSLESNNIYNIQQIKYQEHIQQQQHQFKKYQHQQQMKQFQIQQQHKQQIIQQQENKDQMYQQNQQQNQYKQYINQPGYQEKEDRNCFSNSQFNISSQLDEKNLPQNIQINQDLSNRNNKIINNNFYINICTNDPEKMLDPNQLEQLIRQKNHIPIVNEHNNSRKFSVQNTTINNYNHTTNNSNLNISTTQNTNKSLLKPQIKTFEKPSWLQNHQASKRIMQNSSNIQQLNESLKENRNRQAHSKTIQSNINQELLKPQKTDENRFQDTEKQFYRPYRVKQVNQKLEQIPLNRFLKQSFKINHDPSQYTNNIQ